MAMQHSVTEYFNRFISSEAANSELVRCLPKNPHATAEAFQKDEIRDILLFNILNYLGLKISFMKLIEISLCDALDPHANRTRFTDEMVSLTDDK